MWTDSGQILRHQHGISVAESQTFLRAKRPPAAMSEEKRLFSQAIEWPPNKSLRSMAVLTSALWRGQAASSFLQFLSLPSPSLACLGARPKPPRFACFPFRNCPQCPNQPFTESAKYISLYRILNWLTSICRWIAPRLHSLCYFYLWDAIAKSWT